MALLPDFFSHTKLAIEPPDRNPDFGNSHLDLISLIDSLKSCSIFILDLCFFSHDRLHGASNNCLLNNPILF